MKKWRKNYETSYKHIKGKKKHECYRSESQNKTILNDQWFWVCMCGGGDNDLCVCEYTEKQTNTTRNIDPKLSFLNTRLLNSCFRVLWCCS